MRVGTIGTAGLVTSALLALAIAVGCDPHQNHCLPAPVSVDETSNVVIPEGNHPCGHPEDNDPTWELADDDSHAAPTPPTIDPAASDADSPTASDALVLHSTAGAQHFELDSSHNATVDTDQWLDSTESVVRQKIVREKEIQLELAKCTVAVAEADERYEKLKAKQAIRKLAMTEMSANLSDCQRDLYGCQQQLGQLSSVRETEASSYDACRAELEAAAATLQQRSEAAERDLQRALRAEARTAALRDDLQQVREDSSMLKGRIAALLEVLNGLNATFQTERVTAEKRIVSLRVDLKHMEREHRICEQVQEEYQKKTVDDSVKLYSQLTATAAALKSAKATIDALRSSCPEANAAQHAEVATLEESLSVTVRPAVAAAATPAALPINVGGVTQWLRQLSDSAVFALLALAAAGAISVIRVLFQGLSFTYHQVHTGRLKGSNAMMAVLLAVCACVSLLYGISTLAAVNSVLTMCRNLWQDLKLFVELFYPLVLFALGAVRNLMR